MAYDYHPRQVSPMAYDRAVLGMSAAVAVGSDGSVALPFLGRNVSWSHGFAQEPQRPQQLQRQPKYQLLAQQHRLQQPQLLQLSQQQQQQKSNTVLRLVREQEGRCPTCNIQTHELRYDAAHAMQAGQVATNGQSFLHKYPLTIDDEVYRGRCLLCHPVADEHSVSQASTAVRSLGSGYVSGGGLDPPPQFARSLPAPPLPSQQDSQQIHSVSHDEDGPRRSQSALLADEMNDDSSEHETDEGEILDILHRMRLRPSDVVAQSEALHSLWVLSWENENALAIGRLGGVPLILETLRYHLAAYVDINSRYNRGNHTNSPSACRQMQLQSNGLATIQNLSSAGGRNRELLVAGGGDCNSTSAGGGAVPLILFCMSTFVGNAEIQRAGCHALANLLGVGGGGDEGRRCGLVVLASGGLDVVSRSLAAHGDDEGVARGAYKCLRLLGQNPSWEDLAPRMEEEGGALSGHSLLQR